MITPALRLSIIYLTLLNQQDPINGAQLAGEWGTREAFTSVVTTNLPMIFPLLKTWLKPLFGSALSSTRTTPKYPAGFRTIGGGDPESSGLGQRRKPTTSSKKHTTDSVSFSASDECIVSNVKMQNLEIYSRPGESTKGIMVSNEFQIAEDKVSQNGDQKVKHVHEPW